MSTFDSSNTFNVKTSSVNGTSKWYDVHVNNKKIGMVHQYKDLQTGEHHIHAYGADYVVFRADDNINREFLTVEIAANYVAGVSVNQGA